MFTYFRKKYLLRKQNKRIVILNKETNPYDFVKKVKNLSQKDFYRYVNVAHKGTLEVDRDWYKSGGQGECTFWATLCQRQDVLSYLDSPLGKSHSMNHLERAIHLMEDYKKHPEKYPKMFAIP